MHEGANFVLVFYIFAVLNGGISVDGPQMTVVGVHSAKFDNEKDSGAIRNAVLRYDVTHPVT